MTRISDRLVVHRVDDQLVIMDESAGEEVVVEGAEVARLMAAVVKLFFDSPLAEAVRGE